MTADVRVSLTVALGRYDHAHPVVSGEVPIAGTRPTFVRASCPPTCADLLASPGLDLADVALTDYLQTRADGESGVVALPVFLSRVFRHRSIVVHRDRVASPDVLNGARCGAVDRMHPAVVNAIGLLSDGHGLDPDAVRWTSAPDDATLGAMLADGRIDLAITTVPADVVEAAVGAPVGPLFEAPAEAEQRYYDKTGVLPIERLLVVRSELLARHRWLASNLYRSFEIARRRYFERLADIRASRAPIPGAPHHYRRLQGIFGADFWPYGLRGNAASLGAALRYAADLGIGDAGADPASYFAPFEPFVDGI